ncbi:hypothetical protein BDV59DRAFT_86751 [Aspergillus ambiguus]|uniref:uncharacterized protein n=1 Tax=Aspergillus ambiguus TaxID=176160 RepID=UPI003CCCE110
MIASISFRPGRCPAIAVSCRVNRYHSGGVSAPSGSRMMLRWAPMCILLEKRSLVSSCLVMTLVMLVPRIYIPSQPKRPNPARNPDDASEDRKHNADASISRDRSNDGKEIGRQEQV